MDFTPPAVITDNGVRARSANVPTMLTETDLFRMAADVVAGVYRADPPQCDPNDYIDSLVDEAADAITSHDASARTLNGVWNTVMYMVVERL